MVTTRVHREKSRSDRSSGTRGFKGRSRKRGSRGKVSIRGECPFTWQTRFGCGPFVADPLCQVIYGGEYLDISLNKRSSPI
jgi:hypothetical protein